MTHFFSACADYDRRLVAEVPEVEELLLKTSGGLPVERAAPPVVDPDAAEHPVTLPAGTVSPVRSSAAEPDAKDSSASSKTAGSPPPTPLSSAADPATPIEARSADDEEEDEATRQRRADIACLKAELQGSSAQHRLRTAAEDATSGDQSPPAQLRREVRSVRAKLDGPKVARIHTDLRREDRVRELEMQQLAAAAARHRQCDMRTFQLLDSIRRDKEAKAREEQSVLELREAAEALPGDMEPADVVAALAERSAALGVPEERLTTLAMSGKIKVKKRAPLAPLPGGVDITRAETRPAAIAAACAVSPEAPSRSGVGPALDPFQRLRAEELRLQLEAEDKAGGIAQMYNRIALVNSADPAVAAAVDRLRLPQRDDGSRRCQSIFGKGKDKDKNKDSAAAETAQAEESYTVEQPPSTDALPPIIDKTAAQLVQAGSGGGRTKSTLDTLAQRKHSVSHAVAALRAQEAEEQSERERRAAHRHRERHYALSIAAEASAASRPPSATQQLLAVINEQKRAPPAFTAHDDVSLSAVALAATVEGGARPKTVHPIDAYHRLVRRDMALDAAAQRDQAREHYRTVAARRGDESVL